MFYFILGMKEKVYSPGVIGFATRLLAYDEYEGCGGRVAQMAFVLSEKRRQKGLPGTPEDDWREAEHKVLKTLAREVAQKLA
jgi:hypothetical protein